MIFFFPLSNSLVLAAIWTLSGWSLPGILGHVPDLIPPPGGEHWVVAEPPLALVVEILEAEPVDQAVGTVIMMPTVFVQPMIGGDHVDSNRFGSPILASALPHMAVAIVHVDAKGPAIMVHVSLRRTHHE